MEDIIDGRCGWAGTDPAYTRYHDEEWGRIVSDDRRLFEYLILEGAQAGLSWLTILRRRDGYKAAFCDFDPAKVARMTADDVDRLMHFDGIIRNRRKIESAISNAALFLDIVERYGSFHNFIISFFNRGWPIVNRWHSLSEIPTSSVESDAISKAMRKLGFKFFGTTICYAFLQATGYVDDHLADCFRARE